MSKRPNILLLMTDQLRGDCLGAAGHPDVKTPYLDTLAARGVRFENAYSACPSCIAARAALHTGLSQRAHGRVGYEDRVPWRYAHTLAGELANAGYYAQCVGKMHVHPLRSLQGFHHVELHDGYLHAYRNHTTPLYEAQCVADDYFHFLKQELGADADITDTGLECNSWVARPWIYEERLHPTNWVTGRCIDFLRRRDRDKPFFLMASYLRPHPPLDAPQPYFDMYRDKALRPPAVGDWEDGEALARGGRVFDSATGPSDPELIRQMQIGYYACITHLDHQIGRLWQALVDDECADDTVILFTSDHGEELGDHHLFRKSRPYAGSAHVPLIVSAPERLLGARHGQVFSAVAELRDVMPTLLEAAGAPIPPGVEGESLLPLVRGERGRIRETLHGEHAAGDASNQWIVTETDKYCWYSHSGREQYFRLDVDPRELHDEIANPAYAGRIDRLRRTLIRELTGREEGFTDGERLIPGRRAVSTLKTAYGPEPNEEEGVP